LVDYSNTAQHKALFTKSKALFSSIRQINRMKLNEPDDESSQQALKQHGESRVEEYPKRQPAESVLD